MQPKIFTAIDFFYNMTDEDFFEVIEDGALESFCNALTLDLADLDRGKVKNQC